MPRQSKAPLKIDELGFLSEHGMVHELVVERADGQHEMHSWSRARPLLLWSAPKHALVFVHGIRVPRPKKGAPRDEDAAKTYERFHGWEATSHRDLEVPVVPLTDIGHPLTIAYSGPRWRGRVAEHEFGKAVRAYLGKAGARKVYVIAGGRVRMTARGIEG